MAGPREYTKPTLMALAHLSGGLCYYPGCPEEVLREVEGQFFGVAAIAHIKAAYPNGARYDSQMTNDERRDLKNLMLLCGPHHIMIDDLKQTDYYTAELLRRWKEQREADPREALSRLREVTPSGLRKIVADGLEQRDSQLFDALERLESNDHEAATRRSATRCTPRPQTPRPARRGTGAATRAGSPGPQARSGHASSLPSRYRHSRTSADPGANPILQPPPSHTSGRRSGTIPPAHTILVIRPRITVVSDS